MADGTFTERNAGILLGACIACLFVIVMWQSMRANDYQARYYQTRSDWYRTIDRCETNPDGSAVCKPHTFLVPTTTTVAVQGAK